MGRTSRRRAPALQRLGHGDDTDRPSNDRAIVDRLILAVDPRHEKHGGSRQPFRSRAFERAAGNVWARRGGFATRAIELVSTEASRTEFLTCVFHARGVHVIRVTATRPAQRTESGAVFAFAGGPALADPTICSAGCSERRNLWTVSRPSRRAPESAYWRSAVGSALRGDAARRFELDFRMARRLLRDVGVRASRRSKRAILQRRRRRAGRDDVGRVSNASSRSV